MSQPSAFPLNDWGRASDLNNLDVKWFIPGQTELDCVAGKVGKFLHQELVKLEQFNVGKTDLDKEDLQRTLRIICDSIKL